MKQTRVIIRCRLYSQTYIARTIAGGKKATASCTAGMDRAVECCARKVLGKRARIDLAILKEDKTCSDPVDWMVQVRR